MSREHIRVTIERVVGDQVDILHLDLQEVPEKMSRHRAIRFMLAEASEKFYEPISDLHATG